MKRILFVLVAVVAVVGMAIYIGRASGQADKGKPEEVAGKLDRREVQRSALSIANREMVIGFAKNIERSITGQMVLLVDACVQQSDFRFRMRTKIW